MFLLKILCKSFACKYIDKKSIFIIENYLKELLIPTFIAELLIKMTGLSYIYTVSKKLSSLGGLIGLLMSDQKSKYDLSKKSLVCKILAFL